MKNITSFIKITAQGGLLVLLPLLLFILLLTEILDLVVGLATPIADLFPAGTFKNPEHPVALAVILLFGAAFIIGLVMKSAVASRLGNWIQEKTLGKLPIYRFTKSLVAGLIGAKETAGFQPALFNAGHGIREIVYIVEDFDDGNLAVLFPYAPTGFAGPVKIIPEERIEKLDASLGEVSLILNHMGLGTEKVFEKRRTSNEMEPNA